jgi:hypothetical protein
MNVFLGSIDFVMRLVMRLKELWKTESLASEIKCLEKELEYYENHPKIDALWADHDGEIIEFQNAEGIIEQRKIESAKDVFHVIVSSFK